ncbi:hypothetical protein [Aureimonas phyllosphaerae]|uniref:Uncharacterized protein n=1 Tax=Aureimonas phyllosphaerae TaxID=1166078 RepID=A0A7W6BV44_9HYPH|nr:hypothetical protein [Aureimonas phyllosphaerae]MBB3934301.1 hypothetical protein [Aureimonas phyllosphaerae]MBB3958483.1 hypothetical protein [Aureimonas phyllosphaerae]
MSSAPAFCQALTPLCFFLIPVLVVEGARRIWAFRRLWWVVAASYVITPITLFLIQPDFVQGGLVGDAWVGAPWYFSSLWEILIGLCVPSLLVLVHRTVWPDLA